MKERVKAIRNFPADLNCSTSCNKHPYSSHVGVCPYCLTDKLTKLVCSECGKLRVSSCCCSSSSSTSSFFDVGSVGRLSFLIDNENDNIDSHSHSKSKKVVFFRRSSSTCMQGKKKNGFWRIKGLFGKKRNTKDINGGVSRSASFSNAHISDVFFDSNDQFGRFSEEIDRASRSFFPIKGSDFGHLADDSAFIDLNFDSLSKSNQDYLCDHANIYKNEIGGNVASMKSKWGLWKRGFSHNEKRGGLNQQQQGSKK